MLYPWNLQKMHYIRNGLYPALDYSQLILILNSDASDA